jgi:predicted nucleotidyltransferase
MAKEEKSLLQTLAYADVFDYPLTFEEIHCFLIGQKTTKSKVKALAEKSTLVNCQDSFYFFKNRREIVSFRKKRKKWSQGKLIIAKQVAGWLKLIPSIKMIAVTGTLAMENSTEDDDIDLLVISRKNCLWLTRLFTVLLTELIAKRRRPKDKEFKNKICLNMFLDENHLRIPKQEQNLFTAHEVCQLKPLWQKEKIYQKFLKENQWVKQFLPNWKP